MNETLISEKTRLSGRLDFEQGGRIDGVVEGELISGGCLVIGETAEINASVSGCEVVVLGVVKGDIVCSERLELFSGARVEGNLSAPKLVVHDGAVFDGHCSTRERRHSNKGS